MFHHSEHFFGMLIETILVSPVRSTHAGQGKRFNPEVFSRRGATGPHQRECAKRPWTNRTPGRPTWPQVQNSMLAPRTLTSWVSVRIV